MGFISNIGTSFIISKLSKNHKKQLDETKEMVKNKMNTLEQLQVNDNIDLVEKIKNLEEQLNSQKYSSRMCTNCKINVPLESLYCHKCGNKL
jgi:voltage-gated potassium channel